VSAATGAFTSDETQFAINFTAASQSFGGSAQLTTGVPEASTWAMLVAGFGLMALLGVRRSRRDRLASIT
jgi:PEP-CTERM motif